MPLTPWLGTALWLGIMPLFFIDLDRWFGDIPTELQAFAHVTFFGLLALLLMRLPWVRARPFPPRAVQVLQRQGNADDENHQADGSNDEA